MFRQHLATWMLWLANWSAEPLVVRVLLSALWFAHRAQHTFLEHTDRQLSQQGGSRTQACVTLHWQGRMNVPHMTALPPFLAAFWRRHR
mmetsp:Transcript_11973/g.32997  ORF Transcript_11973/g.32997 Transcript_11973/m.32997 type:complete len:89 (+) Transcript_11973:142-408(+)